MFCTAQPLPPLPLHTPTQPQAHTRTQCARASKIRTVGSSCLSCVGPSLPHSTHDAAALPCRLKSALRKKSDKKPLIIDVVGLPLDYRLSLHACPRSARRTRSHLPSQPPALHAAG